VSIQETCNIAITSIAGNLEQTIR